MKPENLYDHVGPSQWIDFEHELRRRHLSSDEFVLSADEPLVAVGSAPPTCDMVTVRHRHSGTVTVREYNSLTWKADLIRDVNAGAF
jgi:hypothetical protein